MKIKIKILTMLVFAIIVSSLNADTLFEIKDAQDSTVFQISNDGLRVFNLGDTLMVISAQEIKANISDGKGKALSRSFSVTTSAAQGKGSSNAFEVTTATTKMGGDGSEYADFSPENIFLGLNAGDVTTGNGYDNVFLGNNTGKINSAGSANVFIGESAGSSNIVGNNNVFIGDSAGKDYDGSSSNVFVGQEAAATLTAGTRNTFVGYSAGSELLTSFDSWGNVYLGAMAGRKVSGSYNVMIGEASGENYQVSGSTGASNVFIGRYSGQHATGSNNVYIGEEAGQGDSGTLNPGNNNIFLGYKAGKNETGSDRLYIDGKGSSSPLIFGTFSYPRMVVIDGKDTDNSSDRTFFSNGEAGGTTAWYNDSDKRLKKNIKTIGSPVDKVSKLRGVTFEWDAGDKYRTGKQIGFIAQETIKVLPEVVDYSEKNDHYSMQYAPITALLVEAVKELKKENENLMQENEKLNKRLNEIEEILKKLNK